MPWKLACALLMLAAWLAPMATAQPAFSQPGRASSLSLRAARAELRKTDAEYEKATLETRKLERDNGWPARTLSYLGPFLTAAVAAGGIFVSVRKVGKDRRETREAAEIERFDERFAKAVTGLSSETRGEQSGAAVLVASMVRDKSDALSDQALQLLIVSLQTSHDEVCDRLLRFALERFSRAAPQRLLATEDGEKVTGLVHIRAPGLNLANLELPGLDIAFAFLHGADFRRANLRGSKGYKTRLEKSILNGADLTEARWVNVHASGASFRLATLLRASLRGAELNAANFFRADLRKADLGHAELLGARFEKASLAGANFSGAQLDDRALNSIRGASDWHLARFGNHHRTLLDELGQT